MKINLKLTSRQCFNLAKKIYDCNFRVHGIGHFDVSLDEFAKIIEIAFNENNTEEKLDKYFEKISPM